MERQMNTETGKAIEAVLAAAPKLKEEARSRPPLAKIAQWMLDRLTQSGDPWRVGDGKGQTSYLESGKAVIWLHNQNRPGEGGGDVLKITIERERP
jgi:hypothetical protein